MKSLSSAFALGALIVMAAPLTAEAREYTVEVTPDNRTCYQVNYIPATYKVNTRGHLVRGASRDWEGTIADGNVIVHRRNPAVYIEKRTLVEADHYSLRKVSC